MRDGGGGSLPGNSPAAPQSKRPDMGSGRSTDGVRDNKKCTPAMSKLQRTTRERMEAMAFYTPGAKIEFDEFGNAYLTIGRQTWYAAAEVPAQVKR